MNHNTPSLTQTKKEAKRLLRLAKDPSFQIQKLTDAQHVMAQLKGYPHWHAYEQQHTTTAIHPLDDAWETLLKPNFVHALGHTPPVNWFNTHGFGCLFGRPGSGKDLVAQLFLTHHLSKHPTQPFGWVSIGPSDGLARPLQEMGIPTLKLNSTEVKAMQRSFNCFAFPMGQTSLSSKHLSLLTDFFLQAWELEKRDEVWLATLLKHFYDTYQAPDWQDFERFLKQTELLPDTLRTKALSQVQQWISYFGIQGGKHYLKSQPSTHYRGVLLDLDKGVPYARIEDFSWANLFLQWVLMPQYSEDNPLLLTWNETQRLSESAQSVWIKNLEKSVFLKETYHFFLSQSLGEILSTLNPKFLKTLVSVDPFYEKMNEVCAQIIPELKPSLQSLYEYAKVLGAGGRFGTLGIFEQHAHGWAFQMGRLVVQVKQLWMLQSQFKENLYFQELVQQQGFHKALQEASETYPRGFIPE